ncbi:MAG TPA: hypothetical protein PKM73_13875 [Verrucomicrobiota bacterium]|nr:hypothetical protein [Verrucomicrobiota bacterium]HNU52584.1 hypothetical protein [Verrucomicrobiota bacterium]
MADPEVRSRVPRPLGSGLCVVLFLAVLLGWMFAKSFRPEMVHFSSDGPLGASSAAFFSVPGIFFGIWQDLNWVGGWGGAGAPNVTNLLLWVLGPLFFGKFYAALSLLVLGVAVWFAFLRLGFRLWVCGLGAIAAALNTDFFSYACWGLGTVALAVAWLFVAIGALGAGAARGWWLRGSVAGFAVGMAIMEGYDVGAILSLYVGAYVVFQAVAGSVGRGRAWLTAGARLGWVVVCAGIVALVTLSTLVSSQVKGVVGMAQDEQSKTARWEDATAWSLPKAETLRVVIPGLYGYRMDTPGGGNYWGRVGERPGLWARHSGAGVYGGVVVVMLAVWAVTQCFRRGGGVYTPEERRVVMFWGVATLVSLLLSWGKHAPFYQILYALPYFSTIRNPIKFLHPFSIGLVMLAGYGLQVLARVYLEKAVAGGKTVRGRLRGWWQAVRGFDRSWVLGCGVVAGASVLGGLLYAASNTELENHLKTAVSPDLASAIARFSLIEYGWYLVFLVLAVVVWILVLSGVLAGGRGRWGILALGGLMTLDLARANAPWVVHWNYREKYASNPIVDILRERAHEHRVVLLPFQLGEAFSTFRQIYSGEWLQHLFQYYNVQSLDMVQDPRPSVDNTLYRAAFAAKQESGLVRLWQLTNTRYCLGVAGDVVGQLNELLDPVRKRFRMHTAFTLGLARPEGPLVVQTNTTGPFALLEFEGALPRAAVYTHWQVLTNGADILERLADPGFDPAQTVCVQAPASLPAQAGPPAAAGAAEFTHYEPKRVRLRVQAKAPSVLLLNDKYDPQWRVTVDGQSRELLRCNYLMRGVLVDAGEHEVEFAFRIASRAFRISLAALAVGVFLTAWLVARSVWRPEGSC